MQTFYKPVIPVYRFDPLPFDYAAQEAGLMQGPRASYELTFIAWAMYMLRQHNKGNLEAAKAEVQRVKRNYFVGIFKDYVAKEV